MLPTLESHSAEFARGKSERAHAQGFLLFQTVLTTFCLGIHVRWLFGSRPTLRASGIGRYSLQSGMASEAVARLARAEHPQHQHVASGFVAVGVRGHPIQRAVATGAGQLADARMLADRM